MQKIPVGILLLAVSLVILLSNSVYGSCPSQCPTGHVCEYPAGGESYCSNSSSLCHGSGLNVSGICHCFSGFTSADNCESSTAGPGCLGDLSTNSTYLNLQVSTLEHSISLTGSKISFDVGYHPGRHLSWFSFGAGTPCDESGIAQFNNSYLEVFSAATCRQVYTLTFPTSFFLSECGLTSNVDDGYEFYEGILTLGFVDSYVNATGQLEISTLNHTISLAYYFAIIVSLASSNPLEVNSPVPVSAVVLDQRYFNINATTEISIQTYTLFPYILSQPQDEINPTPFSVLQNHTSYLTTTQTCLPIAGSGCVQSIKLIISLQNTGVCNIDGDFEISVRALCNPDVPLYLCPFANSEINLQFGTSLGNLCGNGSYIQTVSATLVTMKDNQTEADDQEFFSLGGRVSVRASLSTQIAFSELVLYQLTLVLSNSSRITILAEGEMVSPYNTTLGFLSSWFPKNESQAAETFDFSFIATNGSEPGDLFDPDTLPSVFNVNIEAVFRFSYSLLNKRRGLETKVVKATTWVRFAIPEIKNGEGDSPGDGGVEEDPSGTNTDDGLPAMSAVFMSLIFVLMLHTLLRGPARLKKTKR